MVEVSAGKKRRSRLTDTLKKSVMFQGHIVEQRGVAR
jgi:hypothetical protein